ncbi:hypothetical protein BHE74_00055401 [Ensete ventricosum]|nr:hypothetical protein BHE74_00055401 [Ensete ventricosum]
MCPAGTRSANVSSYTESHDSQRGQSAEKALPSSFPSFALRESHTTHSWKSEGPYYLPNPKLCSEVPPNGKRLLINLAEGKGPMYFHDSLRFYTTYTQSQSPSGPATTPQNGSSCGTFSFLRNTFHSPNNILRLHNIATGNSAKIWTPDLITPYSSVKQLRTVFRFTDKEDRVSLWVVNVILEYAPPHGYKDAQLKKHIRINLVVKNVLVAPNVKA